MLRILAFLFAMVSLSSCTVRINAPWEKQEPSQEKEDSYVLYDFVHTNPPGNLYPPPKLITSAEGSPSYYDENELEAYAAALLAYHSYLVRYLNAMEDSNGNPILEVGKKGCTLKNLLSPELTSPPIMPKSPSVTSIEKSQGSALLVEYLGEVDRWMENTEDYYVDAIEVYEDKLASIREKCL